MAEVDALKQYRLKGFLRILEQQEKLVDFDEKLCMMMLEQINVVDNKAKFIIILL